MLDRGVKATSLNSGDLISFLDTTTIDPMQADMHILPRILSCAASRPTPAYDSLPQCKRVYYATYQTFIYCHPCSRFSRRLAAKQVTLTWRS